MMLDRSAAHQAIAPLAAQMKISHEATADGIIQVANERMTQALRVISVQRGTDPRDFTLTSFGGAGRLHVCALADSLGIQKALVPVHAGVLSALGMLVTRPGRQLSRSHSGLLWELEHHTLEQHLPWNSIPELITAFEQQHKKRYGHCMAVPVELVNLRAALHGSAAAIQLMPPEQKPTGTAYAYGRVAGISSKLPIYARKDLPARQPVRGPALITERVATTWLPPGWVCQQDKVGNLLLNRSN